MSGRSDPRRTRRLIVFAGASLLLAIAAWLGRAVLTANSAGSFMPHGYCYLWDPRVLWLHVISDALITLSYFCIPIALVYFVCRRRDLPFTAIFWMFGLFVIGCGTTHLMEVWNVWHASYMLAGLAKAFTAAVSLVTTAWLIPLIPKALALPSPARLAAINAELKTQIAERERTEAELRELKDQLEARVIQRTTQLANANHAVRDSEERLGSVIASAMDAIITVDDQQRILLFNKAAEEMFCCPAQEALGGPLDRFIPQRFRVGHGAHHTAFSKDGTTRRAMGKLGVLAASRLDGTEFPVEISISQAGAGSQKIFTAIVRDITERHQAEEALRDSDARRRFALETAKLGDWELDLTTLKATRSLLHDQIFGYESPLLEWSFDIFLGHVHPADREAVRENFQNSVRQGKRWEFECRIICPNGDMRWLWACGDQYGELSGHHPRMFGIVKDITERKRAEETVRESEARLHLALESAKAGIWEWDLQTNRNVWSRQLWALYGLELDSREPSYELWLATIHPDDRERVAHAVRQITSTGAELNMEYRTLERNGRSQWLMARGQPMRDGTGQPIRFAGIVLDITERKQAEQALREAQERMAGIIASAMDSIITVDDQHRILLFNAAAERTFRCPAADALGQPLERFIPQRFHAAHAAHIRKFGETGITNRAMGELGALWALRANGDEFQIEASISQVDTAGGKMFTVILRDVTDRKKAEEARELLAAVVESSDDAIIGKTLDGTITSWNSGAQKVFGYSAAEAVGQSMRMLLPPDRVPEESDILARLRRGETVDHFETVRIRKDGKRIDISATISPIKDKSGAVVGVSKIARDISARKLAEEALRESQERFQAMANGIPQLAWMAEADGHIFWYNQRWYEYTGTTFEKMEGWGWQSVHDPGLLPNVLERWKGAIVAGKPFEMEFPLRGADGRFRMFLTRVMPVTDSEGRVLRWFGTNTDISERKEVEERLAAQAEELSRQAVEVSRSRQALEAQSRMLNLVLESMGEGLIAADREGHFLIWNESAKKLLGRGPTDLAPQHWADHYGTYLLDGITLSPVDRLPLVRALNGESLQTELMIRHPEREEGVFLEFTGRPMHDAQGNLCGGVVAFRDISERKAAERKIQQFNQELEARVIERTAQLEEANQELEAFTYSVSHDLRAPLRHISGFSKLLAEEFGSALPPEGQHQLQRIQDGTRRMGQLVDDLLNLGRVGRQELHLQVTGLNSLVEEVISDLKPDYEGRELEWKIAALPFVECDPGLLKNVFQNLLSNAVKYTRPRQQAVIEIGQTLENGVPVVFIRDNGVGFSMKYAHKLFGVFQRLHRVEDFEGTGVGLATTQRIIHKHGGRIWAEADLDKGATFYFTLAASEKSAIKAKAATTGDPS
jgi:PAS domain S-box-containing protein